MARTHVGGELVVGQEQLERVERLARLAAMTNLAYAGSRSLGGRTIAASPRLASRWAMARTQAALATPGGSALPAALPDRIRSLAAFSFLDGSRAISSLLLLDLLDVDSTAVSDRAKLVNAVMGHSERLSRMFARIVKDRFGSIPSLAKVYYTQGLQLMQLGEKAAALEQFWAATTECQVALWLARR